ncbi:hypothetical protein LINPERHAP2_LOCUS41798 [Linum perenne]
MTHISTLLFPDSYFQRRLSLFLCRLVSYSLWRRWHIPLTTTLRGGALEEWNQLMLQLDELPEGILTAGPAAPIWPLEASSQFSVRSLRGSLISDKFPGSLAFPHEVIWLNGVPPKVQAFCWMVSHSKIASLDNLQKRGF